MNPSSIVGLFSLAALGAQAQGTPTPPVTTLDPVLVTATRALSPTPTLRDTAVITREELDTYGALSLGEILQRRAGIELHATGGPGQPQGLFIRGAGSAQTLVLIDGLRAGSATVGTTSIENIPVEMIERIEIVKGPLSSLYGSDAIGGVIQIFTRGAAVPHLFASAGFGNNRERRAAASINTVDGDTAVTLNAGVRKVDAHSATSERIAFCHDPDRDPHENAFASIRASHRLWQGELVTVEAFTTRGKTEFDGCGTNDLNDQTISGARVSSSTRFTNYWSSRLTFGQGRDKLEIRGAFPNRFETRQDQLAWVNELNVPGGSVIAGFEALRQKVISDATAFSQSKRDTNSTFVGLNQEWAGQRIEASYRRDDGDSFGVRNTGSVGYGLPIWDGGPRISATFGRGFRAPTFYDLYGPTSEFYVPNPLLIPEHSRSREVSIRSEGASAFRWRVTAFDNQIDGLIVYVFPTVMNVNRARIRGVEVAAEGVAYGFRWLASATFQRPRDEATGLRLQARAQRFGAIDMSRTFGSWTAGLSVFASGERFDSASESAASRLSPYTLVDARLRYQASKMVAVELIATNIGDRRYETAVGYDGSRRGVLLNVRFDAF
ncbi:MAG: TonB-dependent receptor [Usitatibacter sp.]